VTRVNGRAVAPQTVVDSLWAATAPGRTFSIGVLPEGESNVSRDAAKPPLPPPEEPPERKACNTFATTTLHGASPLSNGLVNEEMAAMRESRQPPLETLHEGALGSPVAARATEVRHRFRFVLAGRGARAVASCLSQSRASREQRPRPADGDEEQQDADLCFYYVLGAWNQLAQISFTIVEGFSDPLPAIQTPESAKGTCVVLLHYRRSHDVLAGGRSATLNPTAVDASISDFDVRVAEANHGMKAMPLFVILSINESAREVDVLSQYLKDWKLQDARPAKLVQAVDDSEESLVDAVQSIAEELVNDQVRRQKIDSFMDEQKFKAGDVNQRKQKRAMSLRYACPLHAAVQANDLEAVEALLQSGADPRAEDSEGKTPVALAHTLNRDMSHKGIINALYEGARQESK
jgi:hypothetical protein